MTGRSIFPKQHPSAPKTTRKTAELLTKPITTGLMMAFLLVVVVSDAVALSWRGTTLLRAKSNHLISSTVEPPPTTASTLAALATPTATLGRIAISSDGNDHDCDDIAATAMTIALLAKTGNASKLVYYGHSDHIWSSNLSEACGTVTDREAEMRISSRGTAERWGGFNLDVFINARAETDAAVGRLVTQINASSSGDRLTIIAAGPMEVVGRALQGAGANKQHVTVVSHSDWNNNHSDNPEANDPPHSGWTWAEMQAAFTTATFTRIADQNTLLTVPESNYFWLRDSADPKLTWLWDRHVVADKNLFDPSDAGMAYWLLTGDQSATPTKLRTMLEAGAPNPTPTPSPTPTPTPAPTPVPSPEPSPTPAPAPTPSSTLTSVLVTAPGGTHLYSVPHGTTINLADLPTRSLSISVVPTTPVGSVRLQYNGQDRTENVAPYSLAGDTDGLFNPADLPLGTHTLTATAFSQANLGGTPGASTTISFTVVDNPNGTPPTLLTEENSDRAIALNAATFVTQPFTLLTELNFSSDKRTRVILFVTNFESSTEGVESDAVVHAENSVIGTQSLTIEHIGRVPNIDGLTQITIILPDGLTNAGDVWVRVVLRGVSSNQARITISQTMAAMMLPSRTRLLVDSWIAPKRRIRWPIAITRRDS